MLYVVVFIVNEVKSLSGTFLKKILSTRLHQWEMTAIVIETITLNPLFRK
jgi:hypothetical protein